MHSVRLIKFRIICTVITPGSPAAFSGTPGSSLQVYHPSSRFIVQVHHPSSRFIIHHLGSSSRFIIHHPGPSLQVYPLLLHHSRITQRPCTALEHMGPFPACPQPDRLSNRSGWGSPAGSSYQGGWLRLEWLAGADWIKTLAIKEAGHGLSGFQVLIGSKH